MTLQGSPSPASASWRVLVALRLLHLRLPSHHNPFPTNSTPSGTLAQALASWYSVVAGDVDTISDVNETKVNATIGVICRVVLMETEEGIKACEELRKEWAAAERDVDGEVRLCLEMEEGILRCEKTIAEDVVKGLTT
jgi:hypothetical protein